MDVAYAFISHLPAIAEDIPIQIELQHKQHSQPSCLYYLLYAFVSPTYASLQLRKMQDV